MIVCIDHKLLVPLHWKRNRGKLLTSVLAFAYNWRNLPHGSERCKKCVRAKKRGWEWRRKEISCPSPSLPILPCHLGSGPGQARPGHRSLHKHRLFSPSPPLSLPLLPKHICTEFVSARREGWEAAPLRKRRETRRTDFSSPKHVPRTTLRSGGREGDAQIIA